MPLMEMFSKHRCLLGVRCQPVTQRPLFPRSLSQASISQTMLLRHWVVTSSLPSGLSVVQNSRRRLFRHLIRASNMQACDHVVSKEVAKGEGARPLLPRSGAAATAIQGRDYDVLMFGGYLETESKQREATNEVWAFRVAEGSWRQLSTNASAPQARIVTQAVAVGSHVWVLAGWDPGSKGDGGAILDDIWRLDLDANDRSRIEVAGEQLPAISRFQACALGSHIYIHTHRSLEDVLVLDTAAQPPSLQRVPVLPDPQHGVPASRGLHSVTPVGSKLFLFGGAPQRGPMMNDLWILDTAQQPLQWQAVVAAEGPTPPPRCSHGAAALGDQLVIVGGSYYKEDGSGLQPLGDCWVLDTSSLRWRQASIEGDVPSPRNAAVLTAAGEGQLVYHGGWWPFRETYNDTFILSLQP